MTKQTLPAKLSAEKQFDVKVPVTNDLHGATQAEHFLLKARLAVAAAIIKSKPRGVSGRQHAEELAAMLERQDEGWKKKAQELQQEVLRLRQEVLISKVTANANNSMEAAGHDETMDISSQDLFGPESVGFSDSDTPDLLLDDLRPAIPSHQPPQPPVPSSDDGGPRGKASLPHVHFLQSLCSLHRVEESSRGLESLWFHPDGGVDSVLVDSVCQLLDSVVAACRDHLPLPGPCDFVLEGCRVAAQAMELFCSQRLPSVEFMRRVEEPLTALTGMLLQSNQLSGVSKEIDGEGVFPCSQCFCTDVSVETPTVGKLPPTVRAVHLKEPLI
ncbi:Meiosis-specific protein MEI4 [Collichthys lucidus]|uniref:Meiosis-specific protein MEI4 n=1 Tax=Collichthys lucidus TaxID=240159 RepID=A0A4U5UKC4_COLLU|nr:Meiosis-specific protein MEI4 [Collichthys lucidus]